MVQHQAVAPDDPVGSCAYFSRLIGSDPDLVLHGGGNTSVKTVHRNLLGDNLEGLYVKASGYDLASIEPDGPLARAGGGLGHGGS